MPNLNTSFALKSPELEKNGQKNWPTRITQLVFLISEVLTSTLTRGFLNINDVSRICINNQGDMAIKRIIFLNLKISRCRPVKVIGIHLKSSYFLIEKRESSSLT